MFQTFDEWWKSSYSGSVGLGGTESFCRAAFEAGQNSVKPSDPAGVECIFNRMCAEVQERCDKTGEFGLVARNTGANQFRFFYKNRMELEGAEKGMTFGDHWIKWKAVHPASGAGEKEGT